MFSLLTLIGGGLAKFVMIVLVVRWLAGIGGGRSSGGSYDGMLGGRTITYTPPHRDDNIGFNSWEQKPHYHEPLGTNDQRF